MAVAPLLIGAGITGLFNWLGARSQANAAKQAAEQQSRATQQAMGLMQQAYAPYLQAGQQSVGVLNRLMTPGVAYTPQMQAMDAAGVRPMPQFAPVPSALERAMARRR